MSMAQLLVRSCFLFTALFVLGYGATALLCHLRQKPFVRTPLWTKVVLWIPIFGLFLLYIARPRSAGYFLVLIVVLLCAAELWERLRVSHHRLLVSMYAITVIIGVGLFAFTPSLLGSSFAPIMLTVGFASVLADVCAFFFGNFFGKHHLPASFNSKKSWEGVCGEMVGAAAGVLLANQVLHVGLSLWLIVPIGIGAILGDMANSYVKRVENIQDWSQRLPGHGGYLDRFASLAGSLILVVLAIKM